MNTSTINSMYSTYFGETEKTILTRTVEHQQEKMGQFWINKTYFKMSQTV